MNFPLLPLPFATTATVVLILTLAFYAKQMFKEEYKTRSSKSKGCKGRGAKQL
jgi:hypothetical protein